MTDGELKPCPFCGGEAKLRYFCEMIRGVLCKDCGATNTPKAWNTRADKPTQNADAVKNALEALEFTQKYAAITFEYWDDGEDMKVGKRLKALSGALPVYHQPLEDAFETIRKALQSQLDGKA